MKKYTKPGTNILLTPLTENKITLPTLTNRNDNLPKTLLADKDYFIRLVLYRHFSDFRHNVLCFFGESGNVLIN